MATQKNNTPKKRSAQSLSAYLAYVRTIKKMSLREVEEAADGAVSNAYLSQLEHGRITRPSPNVLYALANVYGVSYETLMEKAGYIAVPRDEKTDLPSKKLSSLAIETLTKEEEEALLEYLAFLRSKKT